MSRWIKITRNGKSELTQLDTNELKTLPLDQELKYQILDEQGNPLPLQIIENSSQIEVYLPNSKTPILILQNESQFHAVVKFGDTVSLNEVTLATEIISESNSFSRLGYIGGGLAALGGLAFALGGNRSKGGHSSPSTQQPDSNTSQVTEENAQKQAEEQEKARLQAEAEEHARKQAEEQEKARLQAEAEENARKQAEEQEKARLQAEAEETARKQAEEQEKARLQAEAEETARKQAEEQEKARLQAEAEEHARKQAEEQEKARLQAEAEENARKQAEEQEKARLQAEAEENARKQAEEQEKARLQAEAEETARKQAEEAEKARLQAEAEEAARKQAEEAEKARLQAEAEEAARKQAEEAEKARLQAEAEEAARKQAEEETKHNSPELIFNPITGDDIINAEESKQTLVVSGTVKNLQENDRLSLKIGEVSYSATVQDGIFTANVDGKTLATHAIIKAEVLREHQSIEINSDTHQVKVKTELPTTPNVTFDAITGDNIINLVESQQDQISVSGTVESAQEGDEVIVSCGCPICTGTQWVELKTTVQAGKFSVNFAGNQLAKEGYSVVKAQVLTADQYGNQAIGQSEQNYTVDVEAPKPSLIFNPIPTINQTAPDTIQVSGRVLNLKAGESGTVTATIGNQRYTAEIQDGQYHFNVPKAQFADGNKVALKLNVQDIAGNTAELIESNNIQDQHYIYDVSLNKPSIQLNELQQLNSKTPILLSGTVNYDHDVLPSSVKVNVNFENIDYQAQLNGNKWEVILPASAEGTHNATIQVKVADTAGNHAENMLQHQITVEALPELPSTNSQTEIRISDIGEPEQGDMVRIGGKLNLSDLAAKYHNAMQIHEIILTLNNKSYYAGVDSQQHFNLEIPYSDLVAAQGQALNFTLNGDPIYSLEPTYGVGRYSHIRLADNVAHHQLPDITPSDITFEDTPYIQSGKVALHLPEKTSTITGAVSGDVAVGDIITLKVGEQQFETKVTENKEFSLALPTDALKANTSGQILVELRKTENGEAIANTEERYHSGRLLSSELVATYEHSQKNKPYFLEALSYKEPNTNYYLAKTFNYTETLNLTYSFFEPSRGAEGYKYTEISQANRDQARKIFDLYSRYANVKFSQTEHTSGDITYYLHNNTAGNNALHGGRVLFGGRNGQNQDTHRDWSQESFWHLFTHETFHSFGAKHAHENGVVLPKLEDQSSLSVMTYRADRMNLSDYDLKIYDLIYLHFRFGVNPDQRSGNDVYSFKDFDRQRVDGNVYIWDGGGIDTFDASAETEKVFVDLTPGSWIYRGQQTENFIIESSKQITIDDYFAGASEYRPGNTVPSQGEFSNLFEHQFTKGQAYIGYGTQIERLIGSNFNDELKGNVADNDIFGGNGDDKIWGGGGDDYLHGGNGNDYLNGGLGKDTLVGGKGQDTFVFDSLLGNGNLDTILDFNPNEDKIALSTTIFSNLTADNVRTQIQYDTESGMLSYNDTAFAELQSGLSIDQIQFEII